MGLHKSSFFLIDDELAKISALSRHTLSDTLGLVSVICFIFCTFFDIIFIFDKNDLYRFLALKKLLKSGICQILAMAV